MKSKFSDILILTTVILGIATTGLTVWYHFIPMEWLLSTAISVGTTFYHFAMRLLVGAVVPHRDRARCGWFRQRSWEPRLYAILHVKRWKGKMPTYDPRLFSLAYNSLSQIIQNTCHAEVVHAIIMVLSFLPISMIPRFGASAVFWITSLLSATFDGFFVILQRYNRPRLERILEKEKHRP